MEAGNSKVVGRTTHDISQDIRVLHSQVTDHMEPLGECEKIAKQLIAEIGSRRSAGARADAQKWLRREFKAMRILVNVQYEIGKSDPLKAHKLDEAKANAQKALKFPLPDPEKQAKVERWKSDLKSFVSDKIDMELSRTDSLKRDEAIRQQRLDEAASANEIGNSYQIQAQAQMQALAQANQAIVKMETKEESQVRIDVVSTKDWAAASTMKLPPYPQALKNFLAEDCTIWPGKKRSETHIVVPLFSEVSINGEGPIPLTLESLEQLCKSSGGPGYGYFWSQIPKNVPAEKEFCYAVMTNDVIPGSRSASYGTQIKLLPAGYEVPGVLDATRAILWENRRSGKRYFNNDNDPWTYTHCKEVLQGYHLVVGGVAPSGLYVYYDYYGTGDVGIAGWRKF